MSDHNQTMETIDVRGLLCPLPVIRTQETIKKLTPGTILTVLATDPGSLEEATRHLAEAAKLLSDNPRLLSQIADSLARVCNQLGNYSRAVRWFERSLNTKEQLGDRVGMAISYGGLAEALANAGRYEKAIRAYRKDIRLAIETSAENAPILSQLRCKIAECYRRNGQLKEATTELAKAAAEMPPAQRAISAAFIALYRGRLCLDGGAAAEALKIFTRLKTSTKPPPILAIWRRSAWA